MLNGDVLTDLDLTAPARPARARPARARRSRSRRSRTRPHYGLVRTDGDGAVTEFVEKPSPRPDRHAQHLRRRLRARALGARPARARPARLDRARRLPAARRRRPLRLRRARATGSTSGRPSATSRRTFDILEGTVGTAVAERAWATATCASSRRVENAGRIIPSALVESGCRIGDGARIGGRVVLERGVTVGANTTIERAVVMRGAEIGAQLHAARLHRRRRRADRRQHARRGPARCSARA